MITLPSSHLLSGRTITVLVGPDKKRWSLHENLLVHLSDFFRASFRSGFREAADGVLVLEDDDPRAFELFVGYAYSQCLGDTMGTTQAFSVPEGKKITLRDYLSLYVLACKYLMDDLQNQLIDAVYTYCERPASVTLPDIQYIYENTTSGSKMRELLCYHFGPTIMPENCRVLVGYEPTGLKPALKSNPELGFDIIMMICNENVKAFAIRTQLRYEGSRYFHKDASQDELRVAERAD